MLIRSFSDFRTKFSKFTVPRIFCVLIVISNLLVIFMLDRTSGFKNRWSSRVSWNQLWRWNSAFSRPRDSWHIDFRGTKALRFGLWGHKRMSPWQRIEWKRRKMSNTRDWIAETTALKEKLENLTWKIFRSGVVCVKMLARNLRNITRTLSIHEHMSFGLLKVNKGWKCSSCESLFSDARFPLIF